MDEPDSRELKTCSRCGSKAVLVNPQPREFYVRVHRFSQCPDGYQSTCRTAICKTAAEAIAAWNARGPEDKSKPPHRDQRAARAPSPPD